MTDRSEDELFRQEGAHVEWKESHEAKDLLDTICAFANDLEGRGIDGIVIIGVDKHGRATGKYQRGAHADAVQQSIVSLVSSTKILPHPTVTIEERERGGHLVFMVRVKPYEVPPVVKVGGVPYVRVGTVTQRANDSHLRRLDERRPVHLQPFDTRPYAGATLDDLDRPLLEAQYRAAREADDDQATFLDFEQWLAHRELGHVSSSGFVPNTAALLVYGLGPQRLFPGARVDVVCYRGVDFDAPIIARKSALGPLPAQLDTLWTFLADLNAETAEETDSIRVEFEPIFPLAVLKELTRNLVQHRDYSATRAPSRIAWFDDRIVLTNPGAPYGQAATSAFGEHSDYRNPQVTRHLFELGYIDNAGRGVRRVVRALAEKGHRPLDIETNGFTSITVWRRT